MKRKKGHMRKVLAWSVVVAIAISCFFTLSAGADSGSGAVKHVVSHDIAIVFDNSGSMYENDRWCQALYAMEVFASMIDYEHDKLGIYSMWDIQIGKSGKTIKGRLDIASANDVRSIEKIYTPKASGTIMQPAYDAVEYLKGSSLEEKWLIVLTDGEFDQDKASDKSGETKSPEWVSEKMTSFAGSTGINVQYIGFAGASKLNGNESKRFYATNAKTADELTTELVKICNKIFQRNAIKGVASGKFSIDVSMSSLIAFVQGKGAKINSLTDPNHQALSSVMDVKLEAGKEGAASWPFTMANVSGQVVTYGACSAGDYQLDHTGSDVQIFYEPNVRVETMLLDKNGNEVDTSQPINPGDYTVRYGLVDAVTGEDVTDSSLLNPVSLMAKVTNNGQTQEVASGSTISLETDADTTVDISGTFLKDYTISNSDDSGVFSLNVQPPELNPKDLQVKVAVTTFNGGLKWYKLADHEKWTPIRVDVTYQGQPLPDEVLAAGTTFSLTPAGKNVAYRVELIPGESAFNVYIGEDENGNYVQPDTGGYQFTAAVTIQDEYGRELSTKDSDGFEIQVYDAFWRWLKWLVYIAAIIAATLFILSRKAWPHKMQFIKKDEDGNVKGKHPITVGASMTLVPVFGALGVQAKKNTTLMKKFGKKANIYVESVRPRGNVEEFHIGFIPYVKADGYCDSTGNPFMGVVGNNTPIRIVYNDGQEDLIGEIKVN